MKNMLFMCFWGRVKLPSNEVQYRIWEKEESKYAKTPAWIQVRLSLKRGTGNRGMGMGMEMENGERGTGNL